MCSGGSAEMGGSPYSRLGPSKFGVGVLVLVAGDHRHLERAEVLDVVGDRRHVLVAQRHPAALAPVGVRDRAGRAQRRPRCVNGSARYPGSMTSKSVAQSVTGAVCVIGSPLVVRRAAGAGVVLSCALPAGMSDYRRGPRGPAAGRAGLRRDRLAAPQTSYWRDASSAGTRDPGRRRRRSGRITSAPLGRELDDVGLAHRRRCGWGRSSAG